MISRFSCASCKGISFAPLDNYISKVHPFFFSTIQLISAPNSINS